MTHELIPNNQIDGQIIFQKRKPLLPQCQTDFFYITCRTWNHHPLMYEEPNNLKKTLQCRQYKHIITITFEKKKAGLCIASGTSVNVLNLPIIYWHKIRIDFSVERPDWVRCFCYCILFVWFLETFSFLIPRNFATYNTTRQRTFDTSHAPTLLGLVFSVPFRFEKFGHCDNGELFFSFSKFTTTPKAHDHDSSDSLAAVKNRPPNNSKPSAKANKHSLFRSIYFVPSFLPLKIRA